jgi:nanoRNase/pAp phosphatase (c-di-AMP/oligoRNAs hydrolase)
MGQRGSDRFASVYDPNKHEIMLGFAYENTDKITVSLYATHPLIDCGAIAKSCGEAGPFPGGGGHKGAAGFQTSWEFLMGTLLKREEEE